MTFPTIKRLAKALLPGSTYMALKVRRALHGSGDAEVSLLPLLARQGAFVDIGANMGTWTGPAARAFRLVHAFEPDPVISTALRRCAPAT